MHFKSVAKKLLRHARHVGIAAGSLLTLASASLGADLVPVGGAPPLHAMRAFTLVEPRRPCDIEEPWLSNHELLHFDRQGMLSRYDIDAKTKTPLPKLMQRIRFDSRYATDIFASPAGERVLWGQWDGGPIQVMSTSGVPQGSWPFHIATLAQWRPDGYQWLQFIYGKPGSVLLHDIRTPARSVTLPALPAPLQQMQVLRVTPDRRIIAEAFSPDTSPASRVLWITPRRTADISVWSLDRSQPLHRWTISMPGLITGMAVSPQGDRIAWILIDDGDGDAATHRVHETLWISGVDGRDPRVVGEIAQIPAHRGEPSQIRWAPDGKRLSFFHAGALWVTPMP